jgi:hypothetical protein
VDNSIAANKHQQLVKGEKKNAGAALVFAGLFKMRFVLLMLIKEIGISYDKGNGFNQRVGYMC